MAEYCYRFDGILDWQSSSGNAILAFVNNPDSGKIITIENIELNPITSARALTPFNIIRLSTYVGGEDITSSLLKFDSNAPSLSNIKLVRNCSVSGTTYTIRRVVKPWEVVSPASTAPAPLHSLMVSGMFLNKAYTNNTYMNIFGITQSITIRNGEAIGIVGVTSTLVVPVRINLVIDVDGYTYSTSFFALLGGTASGFCPFVLANSSNSIVRIHKLAVIMAGTTDTPYIRIVPISGIQYEATLAQQQKINSNQFVKYDTTAPTLTDSILIAYKDVGVIPYGVPVEYASAGGSANPRGANYLHTRDFIGPNYMVAFPEQRTSSVGTMRDDLGFTISKKFSRVKKGIILRAGEGMAIVSSAETLASWGGSAWWGINFGCDIKVSDIPYTLTLTGLKPNSEVRIYEAGTQNELAGVENSDTTFEFQYTYTPNTYVDIVVHHIDYLYYRIENYLLTNSNSILPISQQRDRQYSNP